MGTARSGTLSALGLAEGELCDRIGPGDPSGQRYRAKHAVRSKQGGKTASLWADIDDERAPREHFARSFSQRRQQIVGDCFQLKTDVDVYNDKNPAQAPIQIPLDFTLDVEELQLPYKGKKAA